VAAQRAIECKAFSGKQFAAIYLKAVKTIASAHAGFVKLLVVVELTNTTNR